MLGSYITSFSDGAFAYAFNVLIALAVCATYVLLGAGWLIMKTEGKLQEHAVKWAKIAWLPVVIGMALISLATPWVSETVRERWFSMPAFIALLPIPIMTIVSLGLLRISLNWKRVLGRQCWVPFVLMVTVFFLGFFGLAYSIYPYVVMDKLDIWQAASAPNSLKVILVGVAITVPMIAAYTVFAYRVFWGKAGELSYA
jgi:cytochrome d ubiquinol oxidase subunit II